MLVSIIRNLAEMYLAWLPAKQRSLGLGGTEFDKKPSRGEGIFKS